MKVLPINNFEVEPWLLEKHYAKRMPQIMFSFGLYKDDILIGVATYGIPASPPLCMGICGKEYADKVLELNRVCLLDNHKNEASFLVARSIKKLPQGKIIVSYADTSENHTGYVYQATNFIYCGLSAKRTDWKVKGMEHLHGQTVADEFRGQPNRSKLMKEKYGDDFYLDLLFYNRTLKLFNGNLKKLKLSTYFTNFRYLIRFGPASPMRFLRFSSYSE